MRRGKEGTEIEREGEKEKRTSFFFFFFLLGEEEEEGKKKRDVRAGKVGAQGEGADRQVPEGAQAHDAAAHGRV